MGIFSFLGSAVGTAIGSAFGPVGAKVGGTIGGALGGAVEKGGKKKQSASQQQAAPEQPKPTMYKSEKVELKGDVKVARAVGVQPLKDPWQPTRDWYEDLGGEKDPNSLDFERYM